MASNEFLEHALSTKVDENVVNAIVGSLENQLIPSVSSAITHGNLVNVIGSQNCNTTPNANSIIGGHKYVTDNISSGGIVNSIHPNLLSNSSASFNNVQVSTASVYSPMSIAGVPNTNEALKVIYSQAQILANHNNNVALSAHNQALVNACVGQASQNHILPGSPVSGILSQGNKNSGMHTPLMLKQTTNTGQVGLQPGMVTVPMSVNSSMPSSIPNVMTLNKPVGQNVVSTQNLGSPQPTIIPNVQILNMRHGAPTVAAQKSVATVSPRVVIGAPQVVGARPTAPITLQTLQSLQPGQQGHLLLKTENGQYQLLRVGPAPAANTLTAPQAQTIRLSTVPAHPGVSTVSTSMAAPPMQTQMPAPPMGSPVPSAPINMTPTMMPQQPPSATTHIKPSDNTKEKCRNFLANLLDLSSKEPPSVERNVRNLIQELIDAQVEPEEFCDRLEKLLNASPQPCLIGFLKKSLPLLRQSLVTKELTIEGINPPSPHVVYSLPPPPPAHSIMAPPNVPMQKPDHRNPKPGSTISVLQNIPIHTKINVNKLNSGKVMTGNNKSNFPRSAGPSAALSTILTPKSYMKDKEKKSLGQFSSQPFVDDKMAGDDDINDVAAMGGVNLAEESQRILGSTEMIGTQIRSCKEEYLVPMTVMQARVKTASLKHGLDEPSPDVAGLMSHAVQERIKNMVEKLAVIAQHRIDLVKTDSRYEVTQDVKNQLKFLEELDRVDKKRREDSEREILLRAAKSRSKNEDPEQAKLKAKAKEMQRAELEELRQREANLTALQAIGPRKKPRLEGPGGSGDSVTNGNGISSAGIAGRSQMALRTRLKRINHRDMVFLLEQESDTAHSTLLYRSYLK